MSSHTFDSLLQSALVKAAASSEAKSEGKRYIAFASREYHCRCTSITYGRRTLVWVTPKKDSVSYVPLTDEEARSLRPSDVPAESSERLITKLAFCAECKGNQFRMSIEKALRTAQNDGQLRRIVQGLLDETVPDFPALSTLEGELE